MMPFSERFQALTGHVPFEWQTQLYEKMSLGHVPKSCDLPTGLGKTAVMPIWLIALAHSTEHSQANGRIPRRLVYVVNRRTVVDQATREAEKMRANLVKAGLVEPLSRLCATAHDMPLAISTLRGQFADNREWSADPSRPAVICGTVDMIGSRLLFSGYRIGFRSRPPHAGFLGQDALLVHDEAHLEPAFQKLIETIEQEQTREAERGVNAPWGGLRVMALSATTRHDAQVEGCQPFHLTDQEKQPPDAIPDPPTRPIHRVWRRLKGKKALCLDHVVDDAKEHATTIARLALAHRESDTAVLIFAQTPDDVKNVHDKLIDKERGVQADHVEQLTGTLRGLERDRMADPRRPDASRVFARFLKPPKPDAPESERWQIEPMGGTVYLICTSAGEVGIDISADHMVCDLSTFDSMAQRFGRVNRYGDRTDTRIDVVRPKEFGKQERSGKLTLDEIDTRRQKTLGLLQSLKGDASPLALSKLDPAARLAAFAPDPAIPPATDILFDAWALTSIRNKMPGRPSVEPYLHGIRDWERPRTSVAWREEVGVLDADELRSRYLPEDLLDDYPLMAHELLSDTSERVLSELDAMHKRLRGDACPIWLVGERGEVEVLSLGTLLDADKRRAIQRIADCTVLLPPSIGGLSDGMLNGSSDHADDVADMSEGAGERRVRVMSDDEEYGDKTKGMRLVRSIEVDPDEGDDAEPRTWDWYKLKPLEGGRTAQQPVLWDIHVGDVAREAIRIVNALSLPREIEEAVKVAAKLHDHGKRRASFQATLGNRGYPGRVLAKSGRAGARLPETYRHEFGSLIDAAEDAEFKGLSTEMRDLVLHLIAAHHGRARPHFPIDEAYDPDHPLTVTNPIACEVVRRFALLQRRYGRWGLAYLESLVRAADWAASAEPSAFETDIKEPRS